LTTANPNPDPNAPPGADFVPTSLAIGRDGDVFVGGLVGEVPGAGQVVELDGRTGALEHTWEGFTTVTGVAVGRDGSLYVSQLFAPQANPLVPDIQGVLTKVTPDGTHHDIDVPFPAGVAVDSHDNVFVSAWSIAPAGGLSDVPPGLTVDTSGQVWRLRF
jgi:sugar lactone lactonase YvrE